MSPVELMALSLGVSIVVATIAGLAAAGLEQVSADPGLRERVWALALYLPVLPPVLVGGLLLTPAPVRAVMVMPVRTEVIQTIPIVVTDIAPVAAGFSPAWPLIAIVVLAIAAGLVSVRSLSLAWRAARLRRLVSRAAPASTQACHAVADAARSLGVAAPSVRATASGSDALLTGLSRPILILPDALAEAPDGPAARAVITHELAHLKRGDHRAVWLEEAVLALLAVNPILPLIRARRAAAREEACDALALTGADVSARRAYAQSLIEALRARTDPLLAVPALTFTGTPRSQAMRRLKSILTPPTTAGRGVRVATLLGGLIVLGLSAVGSIALAAQRELSATPVVQDDGSATAQSAARAAAAAALASLPPEQQERFRNPTAAKYREICSTGEPGDEAFCAGVLFANLPYKGVTPVDFCPPVLANGEFDIEDVVIKGRQNVVAVPVQSGETINGVAKAALRTALPCQVSAKLAQTVPTNGALKEDRQDQVANGDFYIAAEGVIEFKAEQLAALPQPAAGQARLWLGLEIGNTIADLGDTLVVQISGDGGDGVRLAKAASVVITSAGIPDALFLDLGEDYFPSLGGANRAFTITAQIERGGRAVLKAVPATLSLATGSRPMVSRLRPVLTLQPVAL